MATYSTKKALASATATKHLTKNIFPLEAVSELASSAWKFPSGYALFSASVMACWSSMVSTSVVYTFSRAMPADSDVCTSTLWPVAVSMAEATAEVSAVPL